MNITVQPLRLGIVVMKDINTIDPAATTSIRDQRFVDINRVRQAYTFRPILQANFLANGDTYGLITVIRFEYLRNNQPVWKWPQPQPFQAQDMFYPDIVLDLEPYRSGQKMLGMWTVKASVAFTAESNMAARNKMSRYLLSLNHQEFAIFQWEVGIEGARQLTATGELVDRSEQSRSLRSNISVRIDDI